MENSSNNSEAIIPNNYFNVSIIDKNQPSALNSRPLYFF